MYNDPTGRIWGYGISAVIILIAVGIIVKHEFSKKGGCFGSVVMRYKETNLANQEKYVKDIEDKEEAKKLAAELAKKDGYTPAAL